MEEERCYDRRKFPPHTTEGKGEQGWFAFFNGHAEGSRWYCSVYSKPHEPSGLRERGGLSVCQHSNPIKPGSTVIFHKSCRLKYSRGQTECLVSSDERDDSEQRFRSIILTQMKAFWKLQRLCSQLYSFSISPAKQVHGRGRLLGFCISWHGAALFFFSCLKSSSFQVSLKPVG